MKVAKFVTVITLFVCPHTKLQPHIKVGKDAEEEIS